MTEQPVALWTPLQTERLLFRRPEAGDLDAAVRIHTDPATNRHHPEPDSVSVETSTTRFEAMREHWAGHGFGVWVVAEIARPTEIIGFTGVTHRTVHGRNALNLYYRYQPSAWHKGFASEGARLAVELARAHLPQLPVTAYTVETNVGSQKTALGAGLRRMPELDINQGAYEDIYFALDW